MGAGRIAVVNDDTAFLHLMHDLLAEEGYDPIICKEGDGAYQLIRERKPRLIILDIRMEHPDTGWVVLECVRLDPETAAIPVIICSADTQRIREKTAYRRERNCDVLEKPFLLTELLAKVASYIGPAAR
jgi:DNA-binding response OmpR family regulator